MDVNIKYSIRGHIDGLMQAVKTDAIKLLEPVIRQVVEDYLVELEGHMGSIPGTSSYTDGAMSWEPLRYEEDKGGKRFWYESGETANSVVVSFHVSGNSIRVFAGIPRSSTAYDQALWNELGFMPENGDHLIRRPLFLPLAEEHLNVLNQRLRNLAKTHKLKINVSV